MHFLITRDIFYNKRYIDNKRYILPDLVSTRALGHYRNQSEIECDIDFV